MQFKDKNSKIFWKGEYSILFVYVFTRGQVLFSVEDKTQNDSVDLGAA